jgi:hypothetical protein
MGERFAFRFAVAGVMLFAASVTKAQVVFGDFEDQQPDGFGSWNNGVVPFDSDVTGTTYGYSSTGATLRSTALQVSHTGYAQNLAFDFNSNGLTQQFLDNDILSFDVTYPASPAQMGFRQIFGVALNAPGAGFKELDPTAVQDTNQYPPFTEKTETVSINYDTFKSVISDNPNYLQLVIADNAGGGAPPDFFFDNFRLTAVPKFLPADFNDSGKVDFADLLVLAQNYGIKAGVVHATGDANVDGIVDFADLLILAQEYGQGSAAAASSPVPEPSSLAALVSGCLLLVRRRR